MSYTTWSKKTFFQEEQLLAKQFELWGVDDWQVMAANRLKRTALGHEEDPEARRVEVWFMRPDGREIRLAYDKQARAVDNLQAIRLTVEDLRMAEKRGIGDILSAAYAQLAPPTGMPGATTPWQVLGLGLTGILPRDQATRKALAEEAYRRIIAEVHPDRGGSTERAAAVNAAIAAIRATDYAA